MSKTFDSFHAESPEQTRILSICHAYADRFDERLAAGGGMFLCGPPGTGKTHLSCAIGNQLLADGRLVLFSSVLSAVRRVKETYDRGNAETERQVLDLFFAPDLLVLDEIGMQVGSNTEALIIFEIINGRYERVKPTILLSNLNIEEVTRFLGERVMDRMYEGGGVVLALDWESRRKRVKTASTALPGWAVPEATDE